jgi:hypothetical protein
MSLPLSAKQAPPSSMRNSRHQTDVDPQTLIDLGRGDRPLIDLRYMCTNCGSERTDWVVASRRTDPWAPTSW